MVTNVAQTSCQLNSLFGQDVSFLLLSILQSSFSSLLRLCMFFDQTRKAGLNCIEFTKIEKSTGPDLSARLYSLFH